MRCIVIRLNDLLRFRTPHPNVGALPSFTHPNSSTLPKKWYSGWVSSKFPIMFLNVLAPFPGTCSCAKGGHGAVNSAEATKFSVTGWYAQPQAYHEDCSGRHWSIWSLEKQNIKGLKKKKTTKSNTAGKRDCGSLCWHEWVITDVASVLTPKTPACLLKSLHMAMSRAGHQNRLNTVTSNFRVCDLTGNLGADARKSWKWLNSEMHSL